MFNDVTMDFTDSNGKTLDTIVIAGINGSGKTSLLQLLQKLFSEGLNIKNTQSILHKYEDEKSSLICDEVELELDISNDEKSLLKSLAHKHISKITKILGNKHEIVRDLRRIEGLLNKKGQYVKLLYKLGKREKGYIIHQNDFAFFGILPEEELTSIFKVLSFSAVHSDVKKTTSSNTISDFFEDKSSNDSLNSDGIVFPIDIFSHRKAIEKHITESVTAKLMDNRNLLAKDVIEEAIRNINNLLKGISLTTEFVDINSDQPIFQSAYGPKILSEELSDGEKQLYYKAILFDKLRPQNSIIMVDEPETSLHPTWQQEVLKLYDNISGNNQVILVTHSPHIIASIHPENLFILHHNDDAEKMVECFNAKDKGLHTRGNEPNDILNEIMGASMRDANTQKRIEKIINLLESPDKIDEPKNQDYIESLLDDLGNLDPIAMHIEHELAIIEAERN